MTKLKHYQREKIQNWFCPDPGYVLDFTNKTFAEFFDDHFQLNIYADAFSEKGTSKFNRLLAFIELAPPHVVIELLNLLWCRRNSERDEELENAYRAIHSQASTFSVDGVAPMEEAASLENLPFSELLAELAALPSHSADPHLKKISAEWTLDTVEREVSRAEDNLEKDPEAAITAACSLIESLCRSILIARNAELPPKKDIQSLYKALREPLGLSPSKDLQASEVETDVRSVLGALSSAVQGIGALRTHAGTAHGRERGFKPIEPRIARLAVKSSSAVAVFLIETWEEKFPDDKLSTRE